VHTCTDIWLCAQDSRQCTLVQTEGFVNRTVGSAHRYQHVHRTVGSAHRYQHIALNATSTPDSLTDCVITKLQQIADVQKRMGKLSVQQYVLGVAHITTHCGSLHTGPSEHTALQCALCTRRLVMLPTVFSC
jgi:hypothetical protein